MERIAYVRSSNIYDDSRATKEIKALSKQGFFVEVFGWNRDGDASCECNNVFKNDENVRFHFYSCDAKRGIGIAGILKLLKWFFWLNREVRKFKDFSAVHFCNLDTTIGLIEWCKRRQIKIVYDIYDYYVDAHSIPSVLSNTIERIEINVINNSDLVIICTEERRDQIKKANPKKLIVIFNSPDIDEIPHVELEYDYAYCGLLGAMRLIDETLDEYKKYSDVKMIVAGYGIYASKAKTLDSEYENFHFLGSISYSEVLKIEAKAKCLSAIYEPVIRNHRLCAPNKFYESLALGKPVIVCKDTGIDKIVEQYNIGIVINYDAHELYMAIKKLSSDSMLCSRYGLNARKLYESKYKWQLMQQRLIENYLELLDAF